MIRRIYTLFFISVLAWALQAQAQGLPPDLQKFMNSLTPEQQAQFKAFADAGDPVAGGYKEGLMFEGIHPSPDQFSTQQYYPGTETLADNEMRVTFMGSSPAVKENQSGMSIYVELGNGDSFMFDLGANSIRNYGSMGIPFTKMNTLFLTHLHADHMGDIPYWLMFRGWGAGWTAPDIYGPSGRTKKHGIKYAMEGLHQFLFWHEENFNIFPIGEGFSPKIHEFDYRKVGEVIYDKNGVIVKHWPTLHVSDGASGYRLDWNGRSMCFTGDNRPNKIVLEQCKGVDMLISEVFTETLKLQALAVGVPPATTRMTYDNYHTSAYALGYICEKTKPKICVGTHYTFDQVYNNETVAEVRVHWKGPFAFGAPDLVVFNIREDGIWHREGVVAKFAQVPRPQLPPTYRVPVPRHKIEDIQSAWIREMEIPPEEYYPKEYHPKLLKEWPLKEEFIVPIPDKMLDPKYKKQVQKRGLNAQKKVWAQSGA